MTTVPRDADAEGEAVDRAARLLARLAGRDPDLVREVLPTVQPWVRFLPRPTAV